MTFSSRRRDVGRHEAAGTGTTVEQTGTASLPVDMLRRARRHAPAPPTGRP